MVMPCIKRLTIERYQSLKYGTRITMLCHPETPSSGCGPCTVVGWKKHSTGFQCIKDPTVTDFWSCR
jgi:hypothetical protein